MINTVYVIAGPTATGKSDLSISLANKVNGAVINSDSMQVYKNLEILTARPSINEMKSIGHHLYGFVDGNDRYNVNISLLILIGFLIWLATGFYRVEPDEQGVELLFGKWNNQTTQPGLHYFFPTPIGQTITPKVEVIRKINIGFRSASDLGFSSNTNAERKVIEESLMLTGDQK